METTITGFRPVFGRPYHKDSSGMLGSVREPCIHGNLHQPRALESWRRRMLRFMQNCITALL